MENNYQDEVLGTALPYNYGDKYAHLEDLERKLRKQKKKGKGKKKLRKLKHACKKQRKSIAKLERQLRQQRPWWQDGFTAAAPKLVDLAIVYASRQHPKARPPLALPEPRDLD